MWLWSVSMLLSQKLAQFADGVVDDEAHVGGGEAGDGGDLLVGAIVEELEADDFALFWPKAVNAAPDVLVQLPIDRGLTGVGFVRKGCLQRLVITEFKTMIFAENVQSTVPADGKKPGFEIFPDTGRIGKVKFEERILDDIATTLVVSTEDAGCVGDEIAFMLVEGTPHQDRGFILVGVCWHAGEVRG